MVQSVHEIVAHVIIFKVQNSLQLTYDTLHITIVMKALWNALRGRHTRKYGATNGSQTPRDAAQ